MEQQINAFLADYRGIYAPSTQNDLERRFKRLRRDLSALPLEGSDFATFTVTDVRNYAVLLKGRNLKAKTIAHELATLNKLCTYCGNSAVDKARAKYPLMFYAPPRSRYPPLLTTQADNLIATITALPDDTPFPVMRGAMATMLALGAGLRMVELRHLHLRDLSLADAVVNVRVTKGQGTYGLERVAPINPAVLPFMWRYLAVRSEQCPTVRLSPYLLPSIVRGGVIVSNTIRANRVPIERMVGFSYSFRILRRTYAQSVIDLGAKIEAVSVVLGHHTTKTTETYYGRLNPASAVDAVKEVWL